MNYHISCDDCGGWVFRRYHVTLQGTHNHDVLLFFQQIKTYLKQTLFTELSNRKDIKRFMCIHIQYRKYNLDGEEIYSRPYFRSFTQNITNALEIDNQIENAIMKLSSTSHEYHCEGSNWIFHKSPGLDICIATYPPPPHKVSFFLKLLEYIKKKKL